MCCVSTSNYFAMMLLHLSKYNIIAQMNPLSQFTFVIYILLKFSNIILNDNHFSLSNNRDHGQI